MSTKPDNSIDPQLDGQLNDLLAAGKIGETDAASVRKFAEFLRFAGPPVKPGEARAPGDTLADRLTAAGRTDLLEWALGTRDPKVPE